MSALCTTLLLLFWLIKHCNASVMYHSSIENNFSKEILAVASKSGTIPVWVGVFSLDGVTVWKHRGADDLCIFTVLGTGSICDTDGDRVHQKDELKESSCSLEGLPESAS